MAARHAGPRSSIIAPWTTSSDRRSPNGPMCPTAMAGWGWTREATGTCAMTARRPSVHSPHSTGEKLIEFIHRNYESDPAGRWFFQNGPQRVYVELEATPWIWRLQHWPGEVCAVASHTGRAARVRSCLLDEMGRVYLDTDLGFGLVHTQDVAQAAEAVEGEQWSPQDVLASELPERFGFVPSPQAAHRSPAMNLHIG